MGIAAISTQRFAAAELAAINRELAERSPEDIVRWALGTGLRPFLSTSFGPQAAVMLDVVSSVEPSVPVVWIDTGYNLRDTYEVAEKLMQRLPLNMQIYTPRMSAERWNALYGGIPQLDEPELHEQFTRNIKIEPFERALAELRPQLWFTGIRQAETSFRQSLDTVTWDDRRGMLRVAPIFRWSEQDVKDYVERRSLPSCRHYFDPTKVDDNRECGLHTGL
jgi:phosphoadenosine phosphosulfate reductase